MLIWLWLYPLYVVWQEGVENLGLSIDDKELNDDSLEYKDEGYIELVLKVLAQMCDGQFSGLQASITPWIIIILQITTIDCLLYVVEFYL